MSAGDTVQVSFRLPADQAQALEQVARANDRTVSAEIRRLIRRHCDERAAAATAPIPGQLEIEEGQAA